MRCRACNHEYDPAQLFRTVEGIVVMEDLCGTCLHWARAATYDGGPESELEYLSITLGLSYVFDSDSES